MNSEPDSQDVVVMVDHQSGQVSIELPGVEQHIVLPTAWFRVKTKVDEAGMIDVTMKLRADEFHVRPAAPVEVTLTDIPDPVTPGQAFESQLAAIQRQAGHVQ